MNLLLPYTTALLFGAAHALELDHMAAVTAFAIRKPAPMAAVRFGLRWALGHGAAVFLTALLFVSVGTMFPEIASGWFDTGAALLLIGLGLWTFSHARHLHAHAGHGPAQLHSHSFGQPHSHQRAATLVGAMHGLAGAAPTIVLLQLARQESLIQGMVFVTVFAIGTAIGMALYALATGYLAGRAALASERWARKLGQLTGVSTIAIGIIWLLR